jgi:hypothetical protein
VVKVVEERRWRDWVPGELEPAVVVDGACHCNHKPDRGCSEIRLHDLSNDELSEKKTHPELQKDTYERACKDRNDVADDEFDRVCIFRRGTNRCSETMVDLVNAGVQEPRMLYT